MRLYRAGKAPIILIAAGNQPSQSQLVAEADLIANFLGELGVPRSDLVIEDKSKNTYENAMNTASIFKKLGLRNGLLVTSGTHMPRAVAAFRKAGVSVIPVSTDIHGAPIERVGLFSLLPNIASLARTSTAMREIIGLWIYRYRGWA